MSFNNSDDDLDNTYNYNETDNGIESKGNSECAPVSAGTRSKSERGEEMRAPPGPACSKAEFKSRSRSSSVASERRSRRRAGFEANRSATAASNSEQDSDLDERGSSVVILSDDVDADADEEFFSPSGSREPSLKRKADGEEPPEVTQPKQGRPQTTGLYVGRAQAIERVIEKKKEEAKLEQEKILLSLSAGQIFSSIEKDLEEAVEKFENNPTADVAQRARQHMTEIMRVAKSSRNLQGGFVRILKHAAVVGVASAEVLRTRADRDVADSEALRQIKALRRELNDTKREAKAAKEEAEKAKKEAAALREELAETGARQRRGGGSRRVIIEDDDSPPQSPSEKRPSSGTAEEPLAAATLIAEDSPMELEMEGAETGDPATLTYSDERRKEEILPLPEEWPAAMRPAIQGKVKILEDHLLSGHTVRASEDNRRKTSSTHGKAKEGTQDDNRRKTSSTHGKAKEGTQDEVLPSLMERLTPMLEDWLRNNLLSRGLPYTTGGKDPPVEKGNKGGRRKKDPTPPEKAQSGNPAARKEREIATGNPKNELRNTAAGGKTKDAAHPPTSWDEQDPTGTWTEVVKRKRGKKKSSPAATLPPPNRTRERGVPAAEGRAPQEKERTAKG